MKYLGKVKLPTGFVFEAYFVYHGLCPWIQARRPLYELRIHKDEKTAFLYVWGIEEDETLAIENVIFTAFADASLFRVAVGTRKADLLDSINVYTDKIRQAFRDVGLVDEVYVETLQALAFGQYEKEEPHDQAERGPGPAKAS